VSSDDDRRVDQTGWMEQRALVMHFVEKHEAACEDHKVRLTDVEAKLRAAEKWVRAVEGRLDTHMQGESKPPTGPLGIGGPLDVPLGTFLGKILVASLTAVGVAAMIYLLVLAVKGGNAPTELP